MTRSSRSSASLMSVLALALGACTGSIAGDPATDIPGPPPGDGTGGGGARPPGMQMTGGKGGAPGPAPAPIDATATSSSRLYRLSHKQWESTVRDLLRLTAAPGLAATFISEPARGTFDNDGTLLDVAPATWGDYQRAAEIVAEKLVVDPKALAKIVPPTGTTAEARARTFVEAFGLRAHRRPLTEAEIASYVTLFGEATALVGSADPFTDGVQMVVTAMLQSPHFLYRVESSTKAENGRVPLGDYEIASRLSYGLTGTMPDDALFAAAAAKRLTVRENVVAEAKRLLATKAAESVVNDFHHQLLHMTRYDFISKDEKKFPEYKSSLNGYMRTETQTFIKDVLLTRDKGLTELLTAPYTFVNSRVAPLYGLTAPAAPAMGQPDPFVRVELDPSQRAGLLTQVGFLSSYADAREPNTILRGAFVNIDLLCVALPPPPDDAGALPAPVAGKTNRQQVEGHTHNDKCGGCHRTLINPPGFALENFDALGKYRTTDNGLPVDATGSFTLDGQTKTFGTAVELAKQIAASRQAHDCYARNWTEYVLGRTGDREREDEERPLYTALGARSLADGASLKSMLLDLVATDAFLSLKLGVAP